MLLALIEDCIRSDASSEFMQAAHGLLPDYLQSGLWKEHVAGCAAIVFCGQNPAAASDEFSPSTAVQVLDTLTNPRRKTAMTETSSSNAVTVAKVDCCH
jgi:hypothetical protein